MIDEHDVGAHCLAEGYGIMKDALDRALERMIQVAEGRVTPGVSVSALEPRTQDPWPGDQRWDGPHHQRGSTFENGAWRPWRPDDDLVHRHAD